jgi:predicted nucleotidyltransferase
MEQKQQKNYLFEIVNELLKDKSHIRELAKKLNVNHMNILRNINKLSKENVVDYEKVGKNKTCFLKKTAESKAYVFMAESYKLARIIKEYPELRGIIERIQENSKIKLAILFGSYAKGTARHESDIDIFVETNDKNVKKEIEMTNTKLSIKIGKYDKSNLLIKEMEKNHIIIKGVERYYEKNKFFE